MTGSHGFIGTHLSGGLAESGDYQLLGLDIVPRPDQSAYQKVYSWDQLDEIPWDILDTVIHLAGIVHDTRGVVDEQLYRDVNVGLTVKVFERFTDSSAGRFVFFSSVKAVTDFPGSRPVEENDPPNPATIYGKTKLEAEQKILARSLPDGKGIHILRPCLIHGPGHKGNLISLAKWVERGLPYPFGSFQNLRSYTSVDNLMFIVRKIVRGAIPGGLYHIADDDPVPTVDLIRMMARGSGRKGRILKTGKGFWKLAARTGNTLGLSFNSEVLDKLTGDYIVSNRKITRAMGESLPVSARDGLKKTIDSMYRD